MKFSQEINEKENAITHYGSGVLTVNGTEYKHSIILSAQTLITDWRVTDVAGFTTEDLDVALKDDPDLILLGTGSRFCMPDMRLQAHFLQQGIGCEAMDSGAACRTYNVLLAEGRRVAAAILLP